MVNEKVRENVVAWPSFHARAEVFPMLFDRAIALELESVKERTFLVNFFIHCFQSFEDEMVEKACRPYVVVRRGFDDDACV